MTREGFGVFYTDKTSNVFGISLVQCIPGAIIREHHILKVVCKAF